MNTKKKEIHKKRKRQKEERTSVPRPLSWNILPQIGLIRRVYTTAQQAVFPLYSDRKQCTNIIHESLYVNKSVSVAGFSGFVCIINNQILRKHTAILVCPVQGKQCVHLKFSDNFCRKNY